MNWNNYQIKRARFLCVYGSLPWLAVRLLVLCLGTIGLLIIALDQIWSINNFLFSLSALAVALFLAAGSFHLYMFYLFFHPEFMISLAQKKADPLLAVDFDLADVLSQWRKTGSLAILWQSVFKRPKVAIILYRLGIRDGDLPTILPNLSISDVEKWLVERVKTLPDTAQNITLFDFLDWILTRRDFLAIAEKMALAPEEIRTLIDFYRSLAQRQSLSNQLGKTGGFARNWSVSYTNLLDRYTEELTERNTRYFALSPLFSREELLKEMAAAASKHTGHNVLLIGEEGIGRSELFFHLASKIVRYQTNSVLDGCQVRLLNLATIMEAHHDGRQLAETMYRLLNELVRAGNVVLFVDRIELLLDPSGDLGTADLRQVLGQFLADDRIHLFGELTQEQYLRLVKPNSSLREAFSELDVPPLEGTELEKALLLRLPSLEMRYRVFFLFGAVQTVRQVAGRYLKETASPRRELDILEEAAAAATDGGVINSQDIVAVIEKKAKVPIKYQANEQSILLNLEQLLHQRIVGQDEAIKEVSNALLRARAGLATQSRPIGSFLFLGPTGVGKTETAKTIAEVYFGKSSSLIRLDMTEYAGEDSLEKLLGASTERPGSLALAIQQQPSSVLLLDEVEKSSPQVRNVLLELLDEGQVTTNFGKKLDFTNTIVIATSNAASDQIKRQVETGAVVTSGALVDQLISSRIFLPELINRFDGVVVFLPLTIEQVRQIVDIQLAKLADQLKRDKGVIVTVSPAVLEELARLGYDPVFGARALQRVITDRLETKIARQIVAQGLGPGSRVQIDSLD